MRKVYTHSKRLLSLVLTLALLPCANLGLVTQARATQSASSVTDAELVAANYELTDDEKALLNSGYLTSEAHSYVPPTVADDLIAVDQDSKTLTAKNYKDSKDNTWVPVEAGLYVGETLQEPLTLAEGSSCKTAEYSYTGNAFSAQVKYALSIEVTADRQKALLSAMAGLKNGVDNLDAAAEQDGLSILENDAAKSQMMKLLNGEYVSDMKFGTDAADAVEALYGQYDKNGDRFDLTAALASYADSDKTQYLLEDGDDFYTLLKDTYEDVLAIKDDGVWAKIESAYWLFYNEDGSLTDTGKTFNIYNPEYLENIKLAKTAKNALLASLDDWAKGVAPLVATTADWSAAGNPGLVSSSVSYVELDKKVEALDELTAITSFATALKAAETTVQHNMSVFNVNVTVKLMVADATKDTLVQAGTYEDKATLDENAAKTTIQDAVDQITADATGTWSAYKAEHYVASDYSTDLPETLTEDIDLTVTYVPKQYTVEYSGDAYSGSDKFYYGYMLTLPEHSDSAKAYDYTIGGETYAQGTSYRITGAVTISRKEGKAYSTTTFYKAVADSCDLSDKETKILTSGALKDDKTVNVRYPDAKSGLVTISGKTLTAKTCPSGYKELDWKPYSYQLDENAPVLFNGSTTAELTGTYSSVKVYYRLELSNFEASEVKTVANLPNTLTTEAKAQKSAFEILNGASSAMSQINSGMLSALKGMVSGCYDENKITKEQADNFTTVIQNIQTKSLDKTNNKLKLSVVLDNYNANGLTYYYQNSKAVLDEVEALSGYMDDLMNDRDALVALLEYANYGSYVNSIETIQQKLTSVKNDLKAPNAAIDTESDKLAALVAALGSEGETTTHEGQTAYLTSAPIALAASNKTVVAVTLTVEGGNSTTVTATFDKGSQIDVAALKTSVKNALNTLLGENAPYYTTTYSDTALDDIAGTAGDDVSRAYTWTPKQYTVKIEGADNQTVSINDLTITLPAAADSTKQYQYTIDGESGLTGSYTFKKEHLARLFVDGSYTVQRTVIDVSGNKLDQFVTGINGVNGAVKAELNKDRDTLAVTINTNAEGLSTDLSRFMKGLTVGSYNYVGLNGNAFVSTDGDDGLAVSIQALINALELNSTSIQTLIGADGTINGELLAAKLQLGKDANGKYEQELKMSIKLNGKAPESLIALRGWDWADFELKNGTMSVHLQLPEKVYEIYLAALLLTGTDLNDINDLDARVAYQFLWDLSQPAVGEGVSAVTYKNTLEKLGIEGTKATEYLNEYETYVNKVLGYLNRYNALQFSESGYKMTMVANAARVEQLLGQFIKDQTQLAQVKKMIVECQENGKVEIALAADIKNVANTKFEALVFDRGALNEEGIKNKAKAVDFTSGLKARLQSVSAVCGVILLEDITADLTFKTNTYLDLNGYQIKGNVSVADGAKLTIIDSSLSTDSGAGINGTLTGSFTILGGTYKNGENVTDVKDYLKNGYEQDKTSGLVSNKLYSITEGANGDLTVGLNVDLLDGDTTLNAQLVKALALDICGDVFLNYYATAMLSVDGKTIFDFNKFELLKLWSDSNTKDALITELVNVIGEQGTADFANKLISGLTDFKAIADAIAQNKSLLSFKVTTAPWQVKLVHNTEADYLDVELGSNKTEAMQKTVSIDVKLTGTDKNKERVKAQMENLSVVAVDAGIDENGGKTTLDVSYDAKNKKVTLAGQAHANITIALSDDPDYAVVMGVIMANLGTDAQQTAFKKAVESYYANSAHSTADLKAAFEKLTAGDIFAALAKLNYKDEHKTMDSMFANLGLSGVDAAATAKKLGDKYYRLLDGFGWAMDIALDTIGKTGDSVGMAGLAANAKTYGTYLADKENVTRSVSKELGGYTLTCDMTVSSVSVKLELFKEKPAGVTVTGKVESYGAAQSGVTVTLTDSENEAKTVTTDENGKYEFTGITAGTYTLSATKRGCTKWTKSITVAGDNVTENISIYLLGDVNLDGVVNEKDLTVLKRHLANAEKYPLSAEAKNVADINHDDAVSEKDVTLLKRYLANSIKYPLE